LGLKALGVNYCLATAAVGSLRLDWPIGVMVACTDFIDMSGRNLTLFNKTVTHAAMESPFGANPWFLPAALGKANQGRAVYLQANGPRYETDAEIHAYQGFGADIVGMTAASEATLMREAGIHYECLAVVTNYAAGLGKTVDHRAVGDVMTHSSEPIFSVLTNAANAIRSHIQP
jgi:5'-methylthioadenosine phosphorylase